MFTPKYFEKIAQAEAETAAEPKDALPPFHLSDLGADSWRQRAKLWLFENLLPPVLLLLREFRPVLKIGRFVIVTRDADVRDVLSRPDAFEVPFGPEMTELAGGDNFVLGLDNAAHTAQDDVIRSVVGDQRNWLVEKGLQAAAGPLSDEEILRIIAARDDVELVTKLSRRFAKALLRNSGGRIDVMRDLIARAITETCVRYFGLSIEDPDAFAEWAMSISALLFADPFGDPATRRLALNGAARIRHVIDLSLAAQRGTRGGQAADTVLGRLIALQQTNTAVTDGRIRAILVGMITGFIPTAALAAGRILQELQRRPKVLREAIGLASRASKADEAGSQRAGAAGNSDKEALLTLLYEALRLNPPLMPGQWRYAKQETFIGAGSSRRAVPKDSAVLAATMSALRDRRRVDAPGRFKSDRERKYADLAFGNGPHECLGKYLAMAQITEIFTVLFSQPGLRTSDDTFGRRIRWVGPFPARLDMEFDPPVAQAGQTMLTICAPLRQNADLAEIGRQIAALGNPAGRSMKDMLDETGIVHFASLSLVELGTAAQAAPHLLLELNIDGPKDAAIHAIARADSAGKTLERIFRATPAGRLPLADVLSTYALDLQTRPWGDTGLNFNGTPEFSVADMEIQAALSVFAADTIGYFLRFHVGIGNRALHVLQFVRSLILQPQQWKSAAAQDPALHDLLDRSTEFADFLLVPSRKILQISGWTPRSRPEAVWSFLRSWSFWCFGLPIAGFAALLAAAIFRAIGSHGAAGLAGRLLLAATGGLAASALALGLLAAAFLALLRYHDLTDATDDRNPALAEIREVADVENPPGFAQNHFMAVTELKKGWFRKLTLAMALWGIKQLVLFLFRPGFVLNMGTIHYAKWFRVRDKLIFQANYDGSWESYLEDFIMRAHEGQSAAWSNGAGFPRTRWLVFDGAQDGDRFKRWVRRQQVLAPFWYSRFEYLTTEQIRSNALIHDGLARGYTDSAARAWLDCFGSMPRPDYAIETDEVQSLVFRSQRYLQYTHAALIRLPDARDSRRKWLEALVYDARCQMTFGDHPFAADPDLKNRACFVGFTASGLARLGLSGAEKRDGLGTFPSAFNLGMANRSRTLGDSGRTASREWRWVDNEVEGDATEQPVPPGVDAILIVYAETAEECQSALDQHIALLGNEAVVHVVPTQPAVERLCYDRAGRATIGTGSGYPLDYEHFGFHDGISQPVIRGTQRFLKGVQEQDIVQPGEFILGYRNNQGYYPPTASVRAESDWKNRLPVVACDVPGRFPAFAGGNNEARDFGRNGSFLVVRQLAQNVGAFRDFIEKKSAALLSDYPNLASAVSTPVSPKWIAAKMMGRWPDGTPLVERPGNDPGDGPRRRLERANDFSYGTDDPQGLHCPFGAHIRRANPRDSMEPGDPRELSITNRHRLIRRGRTYDYQPPNEAKEKGLLFSCLCADLERQFEFVQQTWVQNPSFHDLKDEPDPVVAWQRDPTAPHLFTIPTPSGPVRLHDMKSFVTVRAGGYFFLPSRSAMLYLLDVNQDGWTPG
jgi:cytochrome P450/deferrochelatase/peroxidase EfeB